MTKVFAFMFAALLLLSLTACGTPPAEVESSFDDEQTQGEAMQTTAEQSVSTDAVPSADDATTTGDDVTSDTENTTTTDTTEEGSQPETTTTAEKTVKSTTTTTVKPTDKTTAASTTTTKAPTSTQKTQASTASSAVVATESHSAQQTTSHVHTWIKTTKMPATCTEQGYTLVEYSCGKTEKKDYLPALGHTLSKWVTTKAPTNTKDGESKAVCTRCPYEEFKNIPKLPMTKDATAAKILELVNAERTKAGLSPLSYYQAEQAAADQRTHDIETNFSHYRPNGDPFYSLLKGLGTDYYGCGENVAMQFDDAEKVMKAWMDSPDHRANIMDPDFEALVVGIRDGFWVQIFIDLVC